MTGTPSGLGGFVDGQTIDITIEGIGTLSNPARNRDSHDDASAAGRHPVRAPPRSHRPHLGAGARRGSGWARCSRPGALLVTQVSGSEALSGMAATGTTVGAAIAAIPLAALARRAGRAPSLATGALVAAAGAGVGLLAAVLVTSRCCWSGW